MSYRYSGWAGEGLVIPVDTKRGRGTVDNDGKCQIQAKAVMATGQLQVIVGVFSAKHAFLKNK